MDQVTQLIAFWKTHPGIAVGVVAGLMVIYHLLNRKSRLSRELDQRLEQLRKERGDYYGRLRPPDSKS